MLLTLGGMACYCLGRHQGGFTEPLLFTLSPLPMLVWDLDRHAVLAANEAALALFGYSRDALAGAGHGYVVAGSSLFLKKLA